MRTAVNQAPGGGNDYPFVDADPLGPSFLDVYLSYVDDRCVFEYPFYLSIFPIQTGFIGYININETNPYSGGAGDNAIYVDASNGGGAFANPVFGMKVLDANGATVFSGVTQRRTAWDSDRHICECAIDYAVFRAVVSFSAFSQLAASTWITSQKPLDPRTYSRLPRRVTSLRVDIHGYDEHINLMAGNNIQLTEEDAETVDGGRTGSVITINGIPGAGMGRMPGCVETASPVRLINQIPPDANGNFIIEAEECHRWQRDIRFGTVEGLSTAFFGPTPDDALQEEQRHKLVFYNDCRPCYDCKYFAQTYKGLKKVWERYKILAKDLIAIRDLYEQNVQRWLVGLDCRTSRALQLVLKKEPRCRTFIGLSFCNFTKCCLTNSQVRFSIFRYFNGAQIGPPNYATVVEAYMAIGSGPEVSVSLSGGWPTWYADIPNLNPGDSVTLRVRICSDCIGDEIWHVHGTVQFADSALKPTIYGKTECTAPAPINPHVRSDEDLPSSNPPIRYLVDRAVSLTPEKQKYGCGCFA